MRRTLISNDAILHPGKKESQYNPGINATEQGQDKDSRKSASILVPVEAGRTIARNLPHEAALQRKQ